MDGSPLGPALIPVGDDSLGFTTGMQISKPGQPYLFGDMPVCIDRQGEVMVTRVDFENPRGAIRLEAFALRAFYRPFGGDGIGLGEPITLQRKGIAQGPRVVSQACRPEIFYKQAFSELVLQVSHTGDDTGFSPALIVTYTSDGDDRTLRIPVEFVFCGRKKDMAHRCA
jgi:hypothetical protein